MEYCLNENCYNYDNYKCLRNLYVRVGNERYRYYFATKLADTGKKKQYFHVTSVLKLADRR